MGVIVNGSKGGKNKIAPNKKSSSKGSGCLLFLLIIIGVPVLMVRGCSKGITSRSQPKSQTASESVSAESYLNVNIEESESLAADSAASTASTDSATPDALSEQKPVVASSLQNMSALEAINQYSPNFRTDAEYYRSIRTVQSNGIYSMNGPLVDGAGIFTKDQYVDLCSFLLSLDKLYGIQIGVLTVNDMDGESIEEFSIKHAEKWQLGQKGVDNGVLFVLSLSDRSVRIETGYGAEGALTDAYCSRIINKVMIPSFRSDRYAEGLSEGVKNAAGILLSDESLISPKMNESDIVKDDDVPDSLVIIVIVVFILILLVFGRRTPWIGGGYSGGSHRSSGGGFSGGGFSGGGGSFGGGGASGHW